MFGRSKTTDDAAAQAAAHEAREGAKNRPTPKRRDQEAARRQPLVQTDRKKARTDERQKRNEQLALTRQAMLTGDDKHLPARDKGPVKRYIRDYVDARWNVAEFMLPVMLIVLALSFVRTSQVLLLVTALTYGVILVAAVDTFFLWGRIKKGLLAKFGDGAELRGGGMYTAMRAFQLRRFRMPRPMVERRQYPS